MASCLMGYCYEKGELVDRNLEKALALYRSSAKQGDMFGLFYLGKCYLRGIGVERDEKKAFELIEKSANLGFYEAQDLLGECYLNGWGVEKDEAKAKMWRDTAKKNEVQFY